MAMPDQVTIVLTPEVHKCLLHHLPAKAAAYKPLANATFLSGNVNVGNTFVVECDLDEARSLLAAANRDCKMAVQAIRLAISEQQARRRL